MKNVPVQSLIDHIKTALDVDDWAKEMAERLITEQAKRIEDLEERIAIMTEAGEENGQLEGNHQAPGVVD